MGKPDYCHVIVIIIDRAPMMAWQKQSGGDLLLLLRKSFRRYTCFCRERKKKNKEKACAAAPLIMSRNDGVYDQMMTP